MAMAACCPAMPPCVREDSHWPLDERMQRASFSRVSTPIVRGRISVLARMSGGGGRGGSRGGRGGGRTGPKRSSPRPRRPSGNRPPEEPEAPQEEGPALNYDIRVPLVRLIDIDQKQVGIVPTSQALLTAQRSRADLVLVAPDADPPVAKILDYGKYKFEQHKRKKELQKKAKASRQDIKELRIRYNIAEHDYRVRVKQALKFLKSGDKVKVVMPFKARENQYKQAGLKLLSKFQDELAEISALEGKLHDEGRTFFMTIAPMKHLIEKAEKIKAKAAAAAAAVASGDGNAELSELSEVSDISDVSDVSDLSEIDDLSEDDEEQGEESEQIEASGHEQAGSATVESPV